MPFTKTESVIKQSQCEHDGQQGPTEGEHARPHLSQVADQDQEQEDDKTEEQTQRKLAG
jgi:hypothetical protein